MNATVNPSTIDNVMSDERPAILDENGQPFSPENNPYNFDPSTPNSVRPTTEDGDPMMDHKTASTYVGATMSVVSSVFSFIGKALGDAFWTAFGSHAKITWGTALIFGMGFAVYAIAIGMQVWWLWPLQAAMETLVLGAVFTAVNFIAQFIWNLVKTPIVKAYNWVKGKLSAAWSWFKGLFSKAEKDVTPVQKDTQSNTDPASKGLSTEELENRILDEVMGAAAKIKRQYGAAYMQVVR